MEDFESPSIESSGLSGATEKGAEVSEKTRESYKKAQAQLQRAKKDEKKAKQDNDDLFVILFHFIQNPYYEELVPGVTELLQVSAPSRFLIALISLVYPDAALYFCESLGRREKITLLSHLHHYADGWEFDESTLHPSIPDWMSFWIHGTTEYLTAPTGSIMMQKKMQLLMGQYPDIFEGMITRIVSFFFRGRGIQISEELIRSYAVFIKKNIEKTLQSSVSGHPDADILQNIDINNVELFGL